MKKRYTLALLPVLFVVNYSISQYCPLTGQTPYSSLQPGITNFKLSNVNRSSSNSESASSVVVSTGITATVTAGQTYTISITHSEDTQFFPGARNNLRVWIDYNSNFSYNDVGETALSVDLQAPATTYTATFSVPVSVVSGTYALRATAKMSADAGHTLPTSCNVPADPQGYHGEMEDYILHVVNSNPGQSPVAAFLASPTVCVKAALTLTNNSTGTPSPTYSWTSSPASGVTFTPNNTATNPKVSFLNSGAYTITCIASNSVSSVSISKTLTVNACNSTGLSARELSGQISLAPNPVAGLATIHIPFETGIVRLEITNSLGQLVLEKQVEVNADGKSAIDFSMLGNGIYFVRFDLGTTVINKQIVINNN